MQLEEFLRLTYRQFASLKELHDAQRKRRDGMLEYMVAQLTHIVAITGFRSLEVSASVADFMPSVRSTETSSVAGKVKRRRHTTKKEVEKLRKTMFMLAGL